MTFRQHLIELRNRAKVIFLSFVALLVVFIAVPADPKQVLSFSGQYVTIVSIFLGRVKADILPVGWTLIANKLNEPLEIFLVASLILAMVFNTPIVAYEIFKFVSPALLPREKRLLYPFVGAASAFFAVGTLFGYFVLAKFLIIGLSSFFVISQVSPFVDGADFYFVVFLTIFLSGVAFTIPVFIFLFISFGIVDPGFFKKNRILIWVVVFVFIAFITADGGPLLDLALWIPIIGMLEAAIFLASRFRRRRISSEAGGSEAQQATPPQPPTIANGRCKYCSTQLEPGAIFCSLCGRSNV
ncbi:MAG: twin-arginine translocase subunit TatC [Thaumarchaeota archaeon]|nr:twin-arginine translocase subunit TatC [Nitrososphaerota archaeon]